VIAVLELADGLIVARLTLPKFLLTRPPAIVWGNRVFQLKLSQHGPEDEASYREVFAWWASAK
jgi:hypothetical protein